VAVVGCPILEALLNGGFGFALRKGASVVGGGSGKTFDERLARSAKVGSTVGFGDLISGFCFVGLDIREDGERAFKGTVAC